MKVRKPAKHRVSKRMRLNEEKTSNEQEKIEPKKRVKQNKGNNRIPNEGRFCTNKEILTEGKTAIATIQYIKETMSNLGIDCTDPIQAVKFFNALLQIIPLENVQSIYKKVIGTLDSQPLTVDQAIALFNAQLSRQYKAQDKVLPSKKSVDFKGQVKQSVKIERD